MRLNIIRIIKHFFHTTRRIPAICEPQLWRAASAIKNYTSGLVLSSLATAAARHCSSSSAYTWPTPQYLPPDNLPVKKSSSERSQGLIKSDRFFPSSGDTSERLIIPCQQESGATPPPKLPFFESKATVEPKNIKYGQLRTISTSPLTEYPYLTQTRLSEIFSYCFN